MSFLQGGDVRYVYRFDGEWYVEWEGAWVKESLIKERGDTSQWFPETSDRCLSFHQGLHQAAQAADGDVAVRVLEDMKMNGILPGPRAYHAALHAYCRASDLVAAVNVMRKAFEANVPPPKESALAIARLCMADAEAFFLLFGEREKQDAFYAALLPAFKWLGYDVDGVANAAALRMLRGTPEEAEEAIALFLGRHAHSPLHWRVDGTVLEQIVHHLCAHGGEGGAGERRAAHVLQWGLASASPLTTKSYNGTPRNEEMAVVHQGHLRPLVEYPIRR